jgi:hypothetical protein
MRSERRGLGMDRVERGVPAGRRLVKEIELAHSSVESVFSRS